MTSQKDKENILFVAQEQIEVSITDPFYMAI